jgi:hypothetical protein
VACLHEHTGIAALARAAGFKVSAGPEPDPMVMHLQLR